MDNKIFVYRSAELDKRIKAAADRVSESFGVAGLGNTWHRDEMTRKLNEQTALAEMLESLSQIRPVVVGDILAVDGLSKTSMKAIKAHFWMTDGDTE